MVLAEGGVLRRQWSQGITGGCLSLHVSHSPGGFHRHCLGGVGGVALEKFLHAMLTRLLGVLFWNNFGYIEKLQG